MQGEHHSGVDYWLSRLPHHHSQPLIDRPPSPSPSAHFSLFAHSSYVLFSPHASPRSPNAKRKRSNDDELVNRKRLPPCQPLTRQALQSISGNMGGNQKQDQAQAQESSSISHETTSSELQAKQTKNIDNVRHSLAVNGMWFNVTENLDGCPDFKEKVFKIFEKERPSRMKEASYKKIAQYMKKHATDNEDSYFEGIVDPILKSERTIPTKKRDVEGEILFVCQSFEDDDMIRKRNVQFVKGFLPGKIDKNAEHKLGLTEPKPDYTFGLRRNDRPLPGTSPSDQVEIIIGVVPGMVHPFFVMENKGCDASIDLARNQAIRDGAALVNARIHLNAMAEDQGWQRSKGADMDALVFSCTWDPNMSELWIHWHETLEDGAELFHMNRLGQYLTGNQEHLAQFRHDVHNILDWGVLPNKRKCEEAVQKIMNKAKKKKTKQSGNDESTEFGKLNAGSVAGS